MRLPEMELDLHGLSVEEALYTLEQFLNKAFKDGLYKIWVIHGKGTGIMRQAVTDYLKGHPLVISFSTADPHHGGNGATEVKINEW